jgi:hydrogenase expression/formation protein HypD
VVNGGAPDNATAVQQLAAELNQRVSQPWTLMEVCGGQTHAIVRWGLDQLLPAGLRLIHGPGCPVCVTPATTLDHAMELARQPGVILCSYGDMLRVPGSSPSDLLAVRSAGGDVRLLTSPQQALELARSHPERQVVFLAVGFETTAPATALLARQALALQLPNLSLLVAHVRVAPAMEAILSGEHNQVQGFLAAGNVCAVTGTGEMRQLVRRHQRPVVVTGFAPRELMEGVLACVAMLEDGRAGLANAYGQVVRPEGNRQARALLAEVFAVVDQPWRGFGPITGGGLALSPPYDTLDASRRFGLASPATAHSPAEAETACISGRILQGLSTPTDCPCFGRECTPEHPLGAPMVSSEGTCAAYHRFRPDMQQPRGRSANKFS